MKVRGNDARGTGEMPVYFVTDDLGNRLAGPFDSNSEAWRWIDRRSGDPVSKREQTAEWSWNKWMHGE